MRSILKKISSFVIVVCFVIPAMPLLAAETQGVKSIETGLNSACNSGFGVTCGDKNGDSGIVTDIPGFIGRLVGYALSFIGLGFFLLMVYAGFVWMFARGNSQEVDKAKEIMQSAIIGLIIVVMAYAITVFIGNAITGVEENPF